MSFDTCICVMEPQLKYKIFSSPAKKSLVSFCSLSPPPLSPLGSLIWLFFTFSRAFSKIPFGTCFPWPLLPLPALVLPRLQWEAPSPAPVDPVVTLCHLPGVFPGSQGLLLPRRLRELRCFPSTTLSLFLCWSLLLPSTHPYVYS